MPGPAAGVGGALPSTASAASRNGLLRMNDCRSASSCSSSCSSCSLPSSSLVQPSSGGSGMVDGCESVDAALAKGTDSSKAGAGGMAALDSSCPALAVDCSGAAALARKGLSRAKSGSVSLGAAPTPPPPKGAVLELGAPQNNPPCCILINSFVASGTCERLLHRRQGNRRKTEHWRYGETQARHRSASQGCSSTKQHGGLKNCIKHSKEVAPCTLESDIRFEWLACFQHVPERPPACFPASSGPRERTNHRACTHYLHCL